MNPAGFGAASWRPVRGREVGLLRQGLPSRIAPMSATVQQATVSAAAKFFTPAFRVEAPDYGDAPRADHGSVVSSFKGLSGLGNVEGLGSLGSLGTIWFNTLGCDSFEMAVNDLGVIVSRANTSTPAIERARQVYEDETSALPWKRSQVSFVNCSARTAYIAAIAAAANADLPANMRLVLAPKVQEVLNERNADTANAGKPPEEMSATAKFAIVGGITVVGIIGVAVIVGQVAPLLRALKMK